MIKKLIIFWILALFILTALGKDAKGTDYPVNIRPFKKSFKFNYVEEGRGFRALISTKPVESLIRMHDEAFKQGYQDYAATALNPKSFWSILEMLLEVPQGTEYFETIYNGVDTETTEVYNITDGLCSYDLTVTLTTPQRHAKAPLRNAVFSNSETGDSVEIALAPFETTYFRQADISVVSPSREDRELKICTGVDIKRAENSEGGSVIFGFNEASVTMRLDLPLVITENFRGAKNSRNFSVSYSPKIRASAFNKESGEREVLQDDMYQGYPELLEVNSY
ncbi:hypothetical protein Dip518_000120 [Parelusimicrobium proximum]|uniref:hypothetical protein n=1 Tax=Parelusimicrobium proximum TaxID=3228953 RepID=UPI003D1836B1